MFNIKIGVMTTKKNLGGTFISIYIANLLKKIGKKVALIELYNNDLVKLSKIINEQEQEYYVYDKVEYFSQVSKDKEINIINNSYEYIIYDCGTKTEKFYYMNLKILLVSLLEWNLYETKKILDKINSDVGLDNIYIFAPLSNEKVCKFYSNMWGIKIYSLEYIDDIFNPKKTKYLSKIINMREF